MDDLIKAVSKLDIKTTHEILLDNPDLVKDYHEESPLINADNINCKEIVELLVKFGIDVNFETDDFNSPFKLALEHGNATTVELFLKNKASLEGPQWGDESPAYDVFRRTDNLRSEILEVLIKYGLDLNFRDKYGLNLLSQAFFYLENVNADAIKVVKTLLSAGVPIEDKSELLSQAIFNKNIELVSFLIENGVDLNKDYVYRTPLKEAVLYSENENLVRFLLLNGADVNAIDDDYEDRNDDYLKNHRETILFGALMLTQNEKIVSLLIRKGAKVTWKWPIGWTLFGEVLTEYSGPFRSGNINCLIELIKEFAILKLENRIANDSDLEYLERSRKFPELGLNEIELCLNEMKNTTFYLQYSFYSLLKMPLKKLSHFTKNDELATRFKANIPKFLSYKNDLEEIWKEAVQIRNDAEEVYFRLRSLFGDLFPDLILRKIGDHFNLKDLPLE